jgi:beta-glucanase (GH16 family)
VEYCAIKITEKQQLFLRSKYSFYRLIWCIFDVTKSEKSFNQMKRAAALVILIICFLGCSEEEQKLPSNIQIATTVATDGTGYVSVSVTADDAAYFKINFGEFGASAVESTDGHADHTYAGSGSYLIYVQAFNSADKSADASKEIDIDVDAVIPAVGYSTPSEYAGMTLVWQDEFNGAAVNQGDWTFEIGTGGGGWGNNELEYYTEKNAKIQDGNLVITAKRDNDFGTEYTSSRIITKSKQKFLYGRVDVRAVLPQGQGIWPAIWMLGENINTVSWPKCGEIDIMEMIGGSNRENTVYGTAHYESGGSHAQSGDSYTLASGDFNDKFHVYSIIWDETHIRWYVDDVEFNSVDITEDALKDEFHADQFFIINLAVGGNWPGPPNAETLFPQHLIVDYIRVFQN